MNWQALFYLSPYLISAILSGSITFYAWRRRAIKGAVSFAAIAFSQTLWMLGFIFELLSPSLESKIFWDNLQFAPGLILALAVLAFALQYTERQLPHQKAIFGLLGCPMILFLLLVFTDEFHGLIRPNARLLPNQPFPALVYDFTLAVWLAALYSYGLILAGIMMLINRFIYPHQLYRGQISTIVIGLLIPLVGTVLTLLNLAPTFHRDMTPYTFGLSNLVIAWGLFRYRLFDIAPIARDALIENIQDAVIVLDVRNRLVDLNPATQALLGQKPATLIGQPAAEALADWPALVEQLEVGQAQTQLVLERGARQCHFEVSLSPIHNRRGHLVGRLLVLHDTTARKEIELALLESEKRFRIISEMVSNWVFVTRVEPNGQAIIEWYNKQFEQATGYLLNPLTAPEDWFAIVHPDDKHILEKRVQRLTIQGEEDVSEYRYLTKSGEVRWIRDFARPEWDETKQRVARVYGAAQDITDYKRLEVALRQSEERYRAVVEAQTEIISRHRADGTFIFANDAYCRFFGKSREELLGDRWQPVAVAEDIPHIEQKLATLSPDNPMIVIENRVYSGSGEIRWMQFINQAFFDQHGQLTEFQAVGRDITDRKQAEKTLQLAYDNITQKARHLSLLNEISRTVATVTDWQQTLEMTTTLINLLFQSYATAVLLPDERQAELQVVGYYGATRAEMMLNQTFTIAGDWLAEQVLVSRTPVVTSQADEPASALARAFLCSEESHQLLAVRLPIRGEAIGLVLITNHATHKFDEEEIGLAETVAGQIAGAIETAHLFEAERRQRQIAESLREVAVVLNSNLDHKIVLTKILEQLERVVAYDGAAISLPQEDTLVLSDALEFSQAYIGYRMPFSNNHPAVQVFTTKQAKMIADTRTDPTWEIWHDAPVRSWLGVPLLSGERAIGVLTVDSFKADAYTQADLQILQTFGNQAAIALRNTKQVQLIKEAMYEASLLYRTGDILAKSPDTQQGVLQALEAYLLALDLERGRVILFDLEKGLSKINVCYPDEGTDDFEPYLITAVCRQIIQTGRVIGIADARNDPLLADYREMLLAEEIASMLIAPLIVRGQVVGVLEADAVGAPRAFSEQEINLARAIADQIATAVENARLFEEEQRQRQLAEAQNKELDAFARTVAHDIKNPLSIIVTYSDFLLGHADTLDQESLLQDLEIIRETGRKGANIVDELLLLAGVRKQDVNLKPLDMAFIVELAQQRLGLMIEKYQAELVLPKSWPPALGHTPWVEEVWVNYLSNALKYGGQPPRLELGAAAQPDGMVRFWVRDNGQGLLPEAQTKLFTEFTRLEEVRAKGHGLGLSIVRHIVEKLGGQVGVDSKIGEGSLFYFTLLRAETAD